MRFILAVLLICTLMLSACSGNNPPQKDITSADATTNTGTTTQPSASEPSETAAQSAAENPEKEKVSDYFPFTADVFKKYKGTGNEYAEYTSYVDYVKDGKMQTREYNGGTELIIVYTVRDGALLSSYIRGETYYKYDYTSVVEEEDILLKEPLAEGTSWIAIDGSPRSITAVDKKIETPAGEYSTIEVTTKYKDSIVKDYYAKDIGLVKTEFTTNDAQASVVSELEKIEENVPYKHNVRFYFPQFNSDRIVFMSREIEIKTNEDMKWKFQKELKTVPGTGGLTNTLTKNTQILGISLDDEKDTVTVDLSSDFINEMNAGLSLEGMLLDSITSTFGDYYLKNKVIITIDGKPYESGHLILKPGEAFDVKIEDIAEYK